MKTAIITFVFTLLTCCSLKAQQGAVYNLYFQDHYFINPAAAGSKGHTVFNIAAKEYWLGFPENAPSTQSLVYHTRLKKMNFNLGGNKRYRRSKNKEGRVGFGAMVYNDIIGPLRTTGLLTSYSYFIRVNDVNLSFGLSTYAYQKFVDQQRLILKNPGGSFVSSLDYFYVFDANFGVYLSSKNYYLSLASNDLLASEIQIENSVKTNNKSRSYSFLAGYNMVLNRKLFFEPSFFFQMNEDPTNPNQRLDLNMKFIYDKKFWTGFGFGNGQSPFKAFLGVLSGQFDFGYSYELPGKELNNYSSGSHEVMFTIKFGQSKYNRYQRFYR